MVTSETSDIVVAETPTPSTPPDARQRVEQLYGAEGSLILRRLSLDEDLERARESAGDAALASALGESSSKTAATQLQRIRDEMTTLEAAISAARRQRLATIPLVWAEQAADLRKQVATLQSQVDQRQARTDELLRELEAHEECSYMPEEPGNLRDLVKLHGTYSLRIPKTDAMRHQITDLEQQAVQLEVRQVVTGGRLAVASRKDLFRQLFDHDPMELVPMMFDALNWYDDAVASERERRRKGGVWPVHLEQEIAAELIWSNGQIDRHRSRVDAFKDPGRDLDTIH